MLFWVSCEPWERDQWTVFRNERHPSSVASTSQQLWSPMVMFYLGVHWLVCKANDMFCCSSSTCINQHASAERTKYQYSDGYECYIFSARLISARVCWCLFPPYLMKHHFVTYWDICLSYRMISSSIDAPVIVRSLQPEPQAARFYECVNINS